MQRYQVSPALAETFEPRYWQAQIIGDPKRGIVEDTTKYKVVVAHRKAGKTVMALMYLFMKAFLHRGYATVKSPRNEIRTARFTYIAPTYKQGRDIAWDLMKSIVPSSLLVKRPNETNLEIRMRCSTGDHVLMNIKGADKEDSLRGPGLQFALLDEMGYMKPHVWPQIIQPELASTGGGALFIGTPNGRDHFYQLFSIGRDRVSEEWRSWLLPATKPTHGFAEDTPRGPELLSGNFLEEAKKEVTQKFYDQEYECEFQDDAGMVFDRIEQNVVDEFREFPESGHRYRIGFDPALREDWSVFTVMDLSDHRVKHVYRTNKIDAELLLERAQNMVNTWTTTAGRPELIMDTTGMGDPLYDQLVYRGIPVHPVKFTSSTKRQMVDNLAILFNKDAIKIPRYEWLIDELKDYRFERLLTGRYRYGAPVGKHDDGVTSLFLACWELPPRQPVVRSERRQYEENLNRFTGY